MKTKPSDYYSIYQLLYTILYQCSIEARKGKRKTLDEHRFELNAVAEIYNLVEEIKTRTYTPGRSIVFVIFDPKVREIFAALFRDRVIHHFIYFMIIDWWDPRLIYDSYSCRVGKGTLFGINRAQHFMRNIKETTGEEAFYIKFDLSGYFMSLNREMLLSRVLWGLDQQYAGRQDLEEYQILKFLITQVIMDDPVSKAEFRCTEAERAKVPKNKSLIYQPPGQGIVIGNLTSQVFSNIYLDKLDRFVKNDLKFKCYGRYVDDFFIMVPLSEKDRALKAVSAIRNFLSSELKLSLNEKKTVSGIASHGMDFIGAKIYPDVLYPSNRTINKIKKVFYEFEAGVGGHTPESIQSYIGHVSHMNSEKFLSDLFGKLGWEYGYSEEYDDFIRPNDSGIINPFGNTAGKILH